MTEWKEYKLGEIIQLIGGGTPKTSVPEYWGGNIPWLSVSDFNNGKKYVFTAEKHITQLGLNNSSTKLLHKDDIIISARGTVGVVAMIGSDMAFNQSCYGIRNKDVVDKQYLYYLLVNSVNGLKQNAYGGVFDTITRETFDLIDVILPSLDEQRRISAILSSLDDKIDLLRRENATFEQMAETLFRQWFVVEAKEEWEEKPLSSIAIFLNGLACQKYPPKNEIDKLPVLKIRELSSGIGNDSDWATTDVESEYIVHAGDVIFAWSASLMVKIWDGEDCILNQHLFKVTSEKYPKWFYYYWCKHHLDEFISIAQSHATTMGHIKRNDLDTAMVLVPSDEELLSMTAQMEGLLRKMENNNEQINTLIQTRDGLLPRLMNNEINI